MTDDLTILSFKCPSFGSVGDELAFFTWLESFTTDVRGVHNSIEIKLLVDDDNLREVVAIYFRYGIANAAIIESGKCRQRALVQKRRKVLVRKYFRRLVSLVSTVISGKSK